MKIDLLHNQIDEGAETDAKETGSRGRYIKVRAESITDDAAHLSCKYSQSFIDELARQITPAISSLSSVEGLEGGAVELVITFAPETYFEHTSECVTYRRLLLADRTSAPRDFWVKWTRLDGHGAYSVCDEVNAEGIRFEIGEDVSQKIREREYRFLLRVDTNKYQKAVGRKNITEWRELIRRAVKRGELVKVERPAIIEEATLEIEKQLAEVLGISAEERTPTPAPSEAAELDEITRLAMQALNIAIPEPVTEVAFDEAQPEAQEADEEILDEEGVVVFEDEEEDGADFEVEFEIEDEESLEPEFEEFGIEEEIEIEEPIPEIEEEPITDGDEELELSEDFDDISDYEDLDEIEASLEENAPAIPQISAEELEAKIRAELEAKIRLEYESRARIQAEEEAARLRREHELLRQENERLLAQTRREEAERERLKAIQAEKEAALKAEIEAQARRDAIERERLAEAARLAIIEERKREEERQKAEREKLEAERKLNEERLRREENARIEAERAREAERIRREAAERHAEHKSTAPTSEGKSQSYVNNNYTYTSKRVKLLFRRSVDPNITSRIHEIIKATIEYYNKERVYLKIKATIPDSQTVVLEFASIPMEEMELLSNIIKVLGNSGLGIAKAIVE